jgi:hypothetical protein
VSPGPLLDSPSLLCCQVEQIELSVSKLEMIFSKHPHVLSGVWYQELLNGTFIFLLFLSGVVYDPLILQVILSRPNVSHMETIDF